MVFLSSLGPIYHPGHVVAMEMEPIAQIRAVRKMPLITSVQMHGIATLIFRGLLQVL